MMQTRVTLITNGTIDRTRGGGTVSDIKRTQMYNSHNVDLDKLFDLVEIIDVKLKQIETKLEDMEREIKILRSYEERWLS